MKLAVSEGDLSGQLRKWNPIRLGKVIDCNRDDLWEPISSMAGEAVFLKGGRIVKRVKNSSLYKMPKRVAEEYERCGALDYVFGGTRPKIKGERCGKLDIIG